MEGKTNFKALQALRNRIECLEIIDVGRNLKQFDDLTWLTLTPDFTTDLHHWLESGFLFQQQYPGNW